VAILSYMVYYVLNTWAIEMKGDLPIYYQISYTLNFSITRAEFKVH